MISVERIVDHARAAAPVKDEPAWRRPLEVLVAALNSEPAISGPAAAGLEKAFVHQSATRFRVVECLRTHRVVKDQAVDPVMITGLPRSATTALANLMMVGPDSRVLQEWEVVDPIPGRVDELHQIVRTQRQLDSLVGSRRSGLSTILSQGVEARSSAEDTQLLGLSFSSMQITFLAPLAPYQRSLLQADLHAAYQMQRAVLQILQSHRPPARWVLGNPPSLFSLETMSTSSRAYGSFGPTERQSTRLGPCAISSTDCGSRERIARGGR